MVHSPPGNEVKVISGSLEGTSTDMHGQDDTASTSGEEREVESMLVIEGNDKVKDAQMLQMDTRVDKMLGACGWVGSAILKQRKSRGGHPVVCGCISTD